MNPVYWAKKIFSSTRNKISLKHYLNKNEIVALDISPDSNRLEEKWGFKDANCYVNRGLEWNEKEFIDLSIIIPLYNSEKFIHTCVEQFVCQKTNFKFELILVNDGSKDETLAIAKKYEMENPDIIRVVNQENQGISCARNAGIELAKGKYLSFADHDDRVKECFVERLMTKAYQEDADIVKAAYAKVQDGKTKTIYEQRDEVADRAMKSELFQYSSYIFPGVYKRRLFEHINFPNGYWYEDMIVRTLLYRQSCKFVHISDVLYYKQYHGGNAFSVVWDNKNYKCIEQLYLVMNIIVANDRLELSEDVWFYQCILHEFSTIFCQRIKGLDEVTKQAAFLKACQIIQDLYKEEYDNALNEKDKLWQRAFLQKEYKLWLLLGGCY